MEGTTYTRRRSEIQTYFDRTAIEAWKRFASEAPLGRIRATVREGRAMMRAAMLGQFPVDLTGWRVLDAGCGAGTFAVELARRGARVMAIDLSPEIVRFAEETLPHDLRDGSIEFRAGDMLSASLGEFDAVVAMDSLIHYRLEDAVLALESFARRTRRQIVFTFAPWTPMLALMHGLGRLFPRADRAPSIIPVRPEDLAAATAGLAGWGRGSTQRISHGFYTSQMMEFARQ